MGHEAVGRQVGIERRVYVPLLGRCGIERGGSEMLHQEMNHLFVLLAVVGAGAVYEQSARAQGVPYVDEDFALAVGTQVYLGGRPFVDGLRIFTEHAFARAGSVDQYHVEVVAQSAEVGCRVAGYHGVVEAPFCDVLGQDMGPVAHHLVAHG